MSTAQSVSTSSKASDWKQDYAEFYPQMLEEDIRQFDILPSKIKVKSKVKSKKPVVSQQIDWIVVMRGMAYARKQQEQQDKHANNIRQISSPKIDETSLSSHIFRVLSSIKTPLHITDIITQVESLGWKSSSQYHKYSQFQHTLSDGYYMFEKVDTGTYTIRTAFRSEKPSKPIGKTVVSRANTPIATLKDLIADLVKKYETMTPLQVHYALFDEFGLWLSYSAVWRALQKDRFARSKNGYRIC